MEIAVKNCWVVFPSATLEKANEAVSAWRKQGYKTLVFQDIGSTPCDADVIRMGIFPGYYKIINSLVDGALAEGADLITCIGDDMLPDPVNTAQDIADAYFEVYMRGEGVLQATGDMQGQDGNGIQAAARICGSPTFGREWILRSYEGKGPFWSGYGSFYGDEDLWNVAKMHDLLWLEPSFSFLHQHWSFNWAERASYQTRNSNEFWEKDAALFSQRKEAGFPKSGLK